jgi:hypothetical protein
VMSTRTLTAPMNTIVIEQWCQVGHQRHGRAIGRTAIISPRTRPPLEGDRHGHSSWRIGLSSRATAGDPHHSSRQPASAPESAAAALKNRLAVRSVVGSGPEDQGRYRSARRAPRAGGRLLVRLVPPAMMRRVPSSAVGGGAVMDGVIEVMAQPS